MVVPVGGTLRVPRGQVLFPAPNNGVYLETTLETRAGFEAGSRIYRVDAQGNVIWSAENPGEAYAVDADFNLYIKIRRQMTSDRYEYKYTKIGFDGQRKWTTEPVISDRSEVDTNPDGYTAFSFIEGQVGVIRYVSPSGVELWSYRLEPDIVTGVYPAATLDVNAEGDVFAGVTYWYEAVEYQTRIFKISANGQLMLEYHDPRIGKDSFRDLVDDGDGGVFFHFTEFSTNLFYVQGHLSREGITSYLTAHTPAHDQVFTIHYVDGKVLTEAYYPGVSNPLFGIFSSVNGAKLGSKLSELAYHERFLWYEPKSVLEGWVDYASVDKPNGIGTYTIITEGGIRKYAANGTLVAMYRGTFDDSRIVLGTDGAIWSGGAMLGYNSVPWLHEGFRLSKFQQNAEPKPDSIVAKQTHRTTGNVLANDANAGGGSAVLVTTVAHGSLTLRSDGTFFYIPAADFYGTDRFTYRVVKPGLSSPPTTVTLTVPIIFKAIRGAPSVIGGNAWVLNLDMNYEVGMVRGTAALTASSGEVMVPPLVTLVEGLQTKALSIPTRPVPYDTEVAVQVRLCGVTKSMFVTVKPAALSSLTLSKTTIRGGLSFTGLVTLTGKASSGGIEVDLTSNRTSAVVPSSIIVAAGQSSRSFTITSKGVPANTLVTISALVNTVRKTATITLTPPEVIGLVASPTSIRSGGTVTFTVTMNGTASGSYYVTLLSSNRTALPTPLKIAVLAGATTARFTVRAGAVATTVGVQVTATRGLSKTITVLVSR